MALRLNLKAKSALAVGLSVLLLIIGVGSWRDRQMREDYVRTFRAQQKLLADTKADGVADSIELLTGLVERMGLEFDEASFRDPEAQRRFFERTASAKVFFTGFLLAAPDGSVVASSPPRADTAPLNLADRAYFRQVRASGKPAVSDLLVSRLSSQPAFIIAAPLRDARGVPVGVISGGIRFLKLNILSQISRDATGFGGFFALTTRGSEPVYLVHPDASKILRPVGPGDDAVDSASLTDLLRAAESRTGFIRTRSPIRSTNWELNILVPSAGAFAAVHLASDRLIASYAYLGVAAAILAWISTALLLRPLYRLNRAVETVRAAPSAELSPGCMHNDEIGDLARGFGRLLTQLRAQQAELHAAQDASPLGLFRCGIDGQVTYANESYRDILGLGADRSLDDWIGMVPQDIRDQVAADWRRAASAAEPFRGLLRLQRSDGSGVLVSVKTAPVVVEGRHIGRAGTLEDVTEREHNALALRESRERLRLVADNMPALISYLDTDLRFRFANQVYEKWFGFEPSGMLGRSLLEVYGEATFAVIRPRMEAALAGQRVSYEREAVTTEGSRTLFVEITPQQNEQGTVIGLYVLMSDITPRRRAEHALRQSEQRLRAITDRLPMRVAFVGTDERYRFANPAAALALGQTVDDMLGRRVEELFSSEHYRQLQPHIRRALAGETVTFDFESTDAAAYRCFRATYVPQPGGDGGGVSGFISIIGEITSQKLSERRLVELSRIDSLTGLSNRLGFETQLASAIDATRLSKSPMALMYLDIDRFKSINDTYGHLAGDRLLEAFAGRLTRTLRGTDTVTRLGGDEFTVILSGLAQEGDAAKLAANLVAVMQPPFVLEARTISITTSIGVAIYTGAAAIEPNQLIEKADALLYRAKASGRNGFCMGAAQAAAA